MSPDQSDVTPPPKRVLSFGTKLIAAAALLFSMLAVGGVAVLISENQSERDNVVTAETKAQAADAESKDFAAEVDRICKTSTKESRQLRTAGKCEVAKQVIEREGPPGPPGVQGEAGRPPTASEVANAVASFCSVRNQCRGPAGTAGVAGKNAPLPTTAQVAQAVATYCNAKGECKGPVGTAGKEGEPGKDASPAKDGVDGKDGKDGKDGADASAAQIADAVIAYCEVNSCKGEPGKAGTDGKDGGDGKDGKDGETGPDSSLIACTAANGVMQQQEVLQDALTPVKILVCVIP